MVSGAVVILGVLVACGWKTGGKSDQLEKSPQAGIKKGLDTTWQLSKLIVPIYFLVTVLKHTPLMPMLAAAFRPVLGLLGLPGETALAIVMGVFINLYAGIAVTIPLIDSGLLSVKQVTIIAVMLLICHNVPVESAVSQKTGASFWHMTLLRTVVGVSLGVILNLVM